MRERVVSQLLSGIEPHLKNSNTRVYFSGPLVKPPLVDEPDYRDSMSGKGLQQFARHRRNHISFIIARPPRGGQIIKSDGDQSPGSLLGRPVLSFSTGDKGNSQYANN